MTDGFLGRWSRRKQELREGKLLAEPAPPATVPASIPAPETASASAVPCPTTEARPAPGAIAAKPVPAQPPSAPLPTLADVPALTPASDFKPFMARGVTPDVRNAAMKKLFADPQFNVMDRLDTYIDDYSQPDPIPAAMLRQMASAKFLNLWDDEEGKAANTPTGGDDADTPSAQDVAQSGLAPELPAQPDDASTPGATSAPIDIEDAHTDLRLQPDHAPQRESAGPGPA